MRPLLLACLLSAAAIAADPPKPAPPPSAPKGAGGDAARPKASMEIVFESQDDPEAPPIPQGEERRGIGDYVRDNSADIRECYARRLQERPTLQGKLVARFDIGPGGRVIGATADGIADRELQICVVQVVRKWEFPAPSSGGKLRVAYPFKFEPQPAR